MFKPTRDAFVECQESIINELKYIMNEMKAGRQEEAYVAIRDLKNELVRDVQISTGKEKELSPDLTVVR